MPWRRLASCVGVTETLQDEAHVALCRLSLMTLHAKSYSRVLSPDGEDYKVALLVRAVQSAMPELLS